MSQKKPASSTIIEGGTYQALSTMQHDSLSDPHPTLRFDRDQKRISGNTGCNSYSAPIQMEKGTIHIGPARVTKRYCQNTMHIERDFLLSLRNVKTYRTKENRIYFCNEEGNLILKAKNQKGNEQY